MPTGAHSPCILIGEVAARGMGSSIGASPSGTSARTPCGPIDGPRRSHLAHQRPVRPFHTGDFTTTGTASPTRRAQLGAPDNLGAVHPGHLRGKPDYKYDV